jgi:catechol 2,3-dioxygenase-like lactoylglutathione lyase family enzyme
MQVAIIVSDLDAKVQAWNALLGQEPSKVVTTDTVDKTGTVYDGKETPARLRAVVYELGECILELMEPIGGPSVWSEQLEKHGDGLHHIGFLVKGMDVAVRAVEELGIPVVQRAEYTNDYESGRYVYFRSEPQLGAMIEFNELDEPEQASSR